MFSISVSPDLAVNICVHVLILFIFLYLFFLMFISKTGEAVLNNNIDTICQRQIPTVLAQLDKKYGDKIDWKNIKKTCEEIRDNPNTSIDDHIEENNTHYRWVGIAIIIGLTILSIVAYLYYRKNVSIKEILLENMYTFALIGMIEFAFFQATASQYVPAYPTTIGSIVLERIKTNLKTI